MPVYFAILLMEKLIMTLVLPKQHYDSYVYDMDDNVYQRFMIAVKIVVQILERGLEVISLRNWDRRRILMT